MVVVYTDLNNDPIVVITAMIVDKNGLIKDGFNTSNI